MQASYGAVLSTSLMIFWLDQPFPCLRIKDLAILLERALLQAGILFSFTKLWLLRFLMFILVSKLCETSGRLTFVFIISSWVHWPWEVWPMPNCPGIKRMRWNDTHTDVRAAPVSNLLLSSTCDRKSYNFFCIYWNFVKKRKIRKAWKEGDVCAGIVG